jgi:hypothetical protein
VPVEDMKGEVLENIPVRQNVLIDIRELEVLAFLVKINILVFHKTWVYLL